MSNSDSCIQIVEHLLSASAYSRSNRRYNTALGYIYTKPNHPVTALWNFFRQQDPQLLLGLLVACDDPADAYEYPGTKLEAPERSIAAFIALLLVEEYKLCLWSGHKFVLVMS
jgi:hypothetical protein